MKKKKMHENMASRYEDEGSDYEKLFLSFGNPALLPALPWYSIGSAVPSSPVSPVTVRITYLLYIHSAYR